MPDTHLLADWIRPADLPNDLTAALRRLAEAHPLRDCVLDLGGRDWDLYPEVAVEAEVCISNNDSGRVKVPFLLENTSGVIVEGRGARLTVRGTPLAGRGRIGILDTPPLPFVLRQSTAITLRGFSVDWRTPFIAEGRIVASGPRWMEVEWLSPHKHWCWNDHLYVEGEGWTFPAQRLLAVEPESGAIVAGTGDNCGQGFETNWRYGITPEGRVRIEGPLERTPAAGKHLLFWLATFDTGGRRSPAIFLDRCADVRLENVTLHHAWGMGVIAQRCQDLSLSGVVVEPATDRRYSLTADATHFVGCRGRLLLEHCRFQNQFDDGINCHGLFHQVVRVLGPRTVRLRTGHPQHQGVTPYAVGDRLEWLRGANLEILGGGVVTQVAVLNSETFDLTLDAEVPAGLGVGDVAENADWHPDIELRDCIFRWNRARGALLNGRGRIRVQGCHFENAGSAIQIETSATWCESGRVEDLEVRDCVFRDCAHTPMWGSAVIQACPEFPETEGGQSTRRGAFHGRLAVTHCRFEGPAVLPFRAAWVRAASFDHNVLPAAWPQPEISEHA